MSYIKMLIAEDDPVSLTYLLELLRNYKIEILKAHNGEEALEAVRRNPDIALVLMDIKMPKMNGYEATREIRKLRSDLVMVAQTAYALSEERERILDAGFNDYLSKPIRREELFRILRKYLPGLTLD